MKGIPRDPVIQNLRAAETRLMNAIARAKSHGYEVRAEMHGDRPVVEAERRKVAKAT